jgi:hypothetical protein
LVLVASMGIVHRDEKCRVTVVHRQSLERGQRES